MLGRVEELKRNCPSDAGRGLRPLGYRATVRATPVGAELLHGPRVPASQCRRRRRGLFGGVGETIALVVGIAALTGVVIGGAWGLVSSSNSSAEWQAVSQTAQSLLTAYQGESLPSGSLVATAVQDHLIGNAATGTQSGDPVILNPYGGTRSFTGNGLNTLTVVDSELPPDACTNFLKSIPATGWLSAAVGSTTFTTFPISRAAADTACGAGTGTTVSITLTIAQS